MTKKFLLISFILLSLSFPSKANFDFNSNCKQAYQAVFDLRLSDAKNLIQKEKKQNPANGIIILLENYVDYFNLLASENKAEYDRLKRFKSSRLSDLEKKDKNSPYYLFAQAEINLQWGMLESRFQDYFSSGITIRKANRLLSANAEKFPEFLPKSKECRINRCNFRLNPVKFEKGIFYIRD